MKLSLLQKDIPNKLYNNCRFLHQYFGELRVLIKLRLLRNLLIYNVIDK